MFAALRKPCQAGIAVLQRYWLCRARRSRV